MQILFFGDSITQGFHDTECGGWVSRFFAYCNKQILDSDYEKYISVFNFGVSGNRSCDLIERFEAEFNSRADTEPVVTVIAIGINDSIRHVASGDNWCPLPEFEKNVRSMVNIASLKGKVVLVGLTDMQEELLTPIPWFSEYAHHQSDRDLFDEKVKEIAEDMGCVFISLTDLFEGRKSELLTDGLHPNSEGHRSIFQQVKNILEAEGIV